MEDSDLLLTSEVARTLGMSESALRRWRQRRVGPPWIKPGARDVLYPRKELETWIAEHRNGNHR